MNHIVKYVVGIVLSLLVPAANSAVVVDLSPNLTVATPGDPLSFELSVDFGSKTVVGGAIDILFDSRVFSYNPAHFFDFDPAFHHDGGNFETKDPDSAGLVSIGFSNAFGGGFTGPYKVGRLFVDVKPDILQLFPSGIATQITMRDSVDWNGFLDFGFQPVPVDLYDPATVKINVSAVPLPPTAWLFASGLAVLGIFRLRRQLGAVQAETGGSFA